MRIEEEAPRDVACKKGCVCVWQGRRESCKKHRNLRRGNARDAATILLPCSLLSFLAFKDLCFVPYSCLIKCQLPSASIIYWDLTVKPRARVASSLLSPLLHMALAKDRAAQSSKADILQGFEPSCLEQMSFKPHHDWMLGEEEGCTENYFPYLFPASSDMSNTFTFEEDKSSMQETHRRNSSSTVLRFEQKLSHGELYDSHANHLIWDDEWLGILYSNTSSGDGLADIIRQELGRPFLEGGEQASKRHCSNMKKQGKAKSSASKDPQSVAAKNRRERISERLKILQELVPNGTKVDLVTMLEKAISYVKFLQLQVKVLATDEFWPVQGGKPPEVSQVKEAMDAILSSNRVGNCSS
ncbi:hypothetical protein HPP92_026412 [Vanilla planifolia]|uniref:BHLH domain-containing protein n=1 Tax=Vanilla planifolia TaxID=51239 RepID=A0A835PGZ9_VANPL|nr:hypothetical protein HPP92_026412 [Vanilla planifolia]